MYISGWSSIHDTEMIMSDPQLANWPGSLNVHLIGHALACALPNVRLHQQLHAHIHASVM